MTNPEPNAMTPGRTETLLLDFLRDHDADCPVCGYNLRGLTRAVCPECRQTLALTVGAPHLRLAWLFVAVAPGFFSGIAACFLCIPTIGMYVEGGSVVWPFVAVILFGWGSGVFAILLAARRRRFVARTRAQQCLFALYIWIAHVAALIVFIFGLAAVI